MDPIGSIFIAAVILWVILRVIQAAKPRKRGNVCEECRYDLRGNPGAGCPECGWGRTGRTG